MLRQQGKIVYVGSSNFAGWHIAQAQEAARRGTSSASSSEQRIYNLLTAHGRAGGHARVEEYGLGVIPWSPLQGGLLGGVVRKKAGEGRRVGRALEQRVEEEARADRGVRGALQGAGGEAGDVALAWLLRPRPAVTAPIVGPRTEEQLDSAMRAVDVTLDDKALARLDEIFPGYKTAPEEYAW